MDDCFGEKEEKSQSLLHRLEKPENFWNSLQEPFGLWHWHLDACLRLMTKNLNRLPAHGSENVEEEKPAEEENRHGRSQQIESIDWDPMQPSTSTAAAKIDF
ncbi:hypothetical protein niasHT_022900 [Heterodera trifolii]|uniref:Uncharacterized protein n=1 Tax=Heterodera trifolii TaxID=157864 RepID=A0ABD2KAV9_9BILA